MPVDSKNYVGWWKQFSEYIRFERADNRCEVCRVENYSITTRGTKVVLTVAHLDNGFDVCFCREFYGFKCADPSHVKAMCQRCHNSYDAPSRLKNRQETRRQLKHQNQPVLFL